MSFGEFKLVQMTQDARHGNIALAPRLSKVEIEFIILYIRVSRNRTLQKDEQDFPSLKKCLRTVLT